MEELKLEVENVGIFSERDRYQFRKGLNEVKAPNANGKTSLINSLKLFTMDDSDLKNKGYLMNLYTAAHDKIEISLKNNNIDWYRRFRKTGSNLYSFDDEGAIENGEKIRAICFVTPDNELINMIQQGKPIREFIEKISDSKFYDLSINTIKRFKKDFLKQHEKYRESLIQLEFTRKRLEESIEEKENFEKELEELPEIDETEALKDKSMIDSYNEKLTEKRDIDKELRENKGIFDSLEDQIKNLTDTIRRKQNLVDGLKQEYPLLENELKKIAVEIENVNDEKREIDNEKRKIEAAINSANDNWVKIKKHGELISGGIKCFACGQNVSLRNLEKWQRDLELASDDLGEKLIQKEREVEDLLRQKSKFERAQRQSSIAETELNTATDSLQRRERDKKNKVNLINNLEEVQSNIEKEIKEFFELSTTNTFKMWQEREKLIDRIERLKQKVINDKKEIKKIEENTKDVDILLKRINFIDEIVKYLEVRKEQLLINVNNTFKQKINEIFNRLQFKDFKDVELKDDGRITVTRTKEGKIIEKFPFEALSTSERISLAIIFLMAAKQEFIPDFPFFVIDELITSYDPSRFEIIKEYIKNIAEFVIITEFSEMENEGITIVYES